MVQIIQIPPPEEKQDRKELRDKLNEESMYQGNGEINCKSFGCKNKLSITEQLYGRHCTGCSGSDKVIGKR